MPRDPELIQQYQQQLRNNPQFDPLTALKIETEAYGQARLHLALAHLALAAGYQNQHEWLKAALHYEYCFTLCPHLIREVLKTISEHSAPSDEHPLDSGTVIEDAEQLRLLGHCYRLGLGAIKDNTEGVRCYKKAYRADNVSPAVYLADCLRMGKGVEKNEKRAMSLYESAARAGSVLALEKLGWCYLTGAGVEKNVETAVQYYREAADKGLAFAQYRLSKLREGRNSNKISRQAVKYYRLACSQGHPDALEGCQKLIDERTQPRRNPPADIHYQYLMITRNIEGLVLQLRGELSLNFWREFLSDAYIGEKIKVKMLVQMLSKDIDCLNRVFAKRSHQPSAERLPSALLEAVADKLLPAQAEALRKKIKFHTQSVRRISRKRKPCQQAEQKKQSKQTRWGTFEMSVKQEEPARSSSTSDHSCMP